MNSLILPIQSPAQGERTADRMLEARSLRALSISHDDREARNVAGRTGQPLAAVEGAGWDAVRSRRLPIFMMDLCRQFRAWPRCEKCALPFPPLARRKVYGG